MTNHYFKKENLLSPLGRLTDEGAEDAPPTATRENCYLSDRTTEGNLTPFGFSQSTQRNQLEDHLHSVYGSGLTR